MPAIRPPKTVPSGDNKTMQIRARRAKDLDILRAVYMPGQLGPTLHTGSMDYEYRAYCVPSDFALAMARMITEIDYLKFKPTTDRYQDQQLHTTYNRMWGVVMDELSTDKHRWEYTHGADKSYTSYTPGAGKYTSTKVTKNGSTKTGTDTAASRFTDDWDPSYSAPTSLFGPEDPRPFKGELALPFPGELAYRNTSADRDQYEPDPSLADLADGDDVLTAEETKLVDSLYAEIDAILDDSRQVAPIDHSTCHHPHSDNARARCRRRRRRDQAKRIAEIRALIEESYEDAKKDDAIEAEVVG